MRWNIMAPFMDKGQQSQWIDDFVEDSNLTFRKVPSDARAESWHTRGANTGLDGWMNHWKHAQAGRAVESDGLITVFPQLAVTCGAQKRAFRDKRPLVAWCFNLGQCYPGLKQRLSKLALDRVDKFIVHSTAEITAYSDWLGRKPDDFQFVPLQRGELTRTLQEDTEDPFILSMGSARRDYGLLFDVVGRLGYRTIVIAGKQALKGLTPPPNVEVLSGLTHEECRQYVQRARLNVIPVDNNTTASGQVTVIEAMKYGGAVIATSCVGTVDYVNDGTDGILVEAGNREQMEEAIRNLWENEELKTQLGQAAAETARRCYSDEAAARSLASILSNFR